MGTAAAVPTPATSTSTKPMLQQLYLVPLGIFTLAVGKALTQSTFAGFGALPLLVVLALAVGMVGALFPS